MNKNMKSSSSNRIKGTKKKETICGTETEDRFVLVYHTESLKEKEIHYNIDRAMEKCLRAYADSEGPDQTAHPRSLIRAFTVR